MRGFEIRMNYAKAVVGYSIFGEGSDQAGDLVEILGDAYALGRYDYQAGFNYDDAPAMFEGVDELVNSWRNGMNDADEAELLIQSEIQVEDYL